MKPETRVLGLDSCNPKHIVGVVTRGGLYLDGVFVFGRFLKPAILARKVAETKYFPELKAIMMHGAKPPLDTSIIQRETGLPLITISSDGRIDGQGYKRVSAGNRLLHVKTSIHDSSLKEVLLLTMTSGSLPEPVRIAHLLGNLSLPEIDRAR